MQYDQNSYILGMITAFCECVAGGCKRMALSPPMRPEVCASIRGEAEALIERHGLVHWHERNPELEAGARFEWIIIAARQETIDAYLALRAAGHSPARSLKPFHHLLSYDPAQGVSTGYDAWREYFPEG